MAARKLALAAVLAALAFPASGSVVVIGSSAARMCYEAADSPLLPTYDDIEKCDRAFAQEALSRNDTVATHVNRGILRLRRGDTQAAITDFDAAISLDPEQPEAYLNKGAALMRLNDAAGALQLFTVALERNTSRPAIAHYGRGIAHEELGNVRAAYEAYQMASRLAPDWDDPRTELRRFRVVGR